MPDRTTKVVLTATVSGYLQGMEQATRKTRELGAASEKLAKQREGFDVLGRSMLAVGALAAAAVGLAIKEFAEFDAKMSQVQALSHATADDMLLLANAALHMGQAIGFSATEVADAEIELVKAGIAVSDIMGGALAGALQLAAAGQIEVADATEIATIAMTQFGLKGADIPHVADLLAAGADKALGGVGDLGEALKSGGLVAAQFGVSLEETAGTLAAFANSGILGEAAGTDLRQMLLKLAAPAADAQKAMTDLGISIYDKTTGAFVGISNLAGQLQDKLSGLTEAQRNATLATIFGARAIAGANVLYKEGAKGISDWTDEVNDSGFAAEQAAGKMDNLKGDISKLEAAFNTGLIESGSSANEVLRGLIQTVTGFVTFIGNLPQPVLVAGLALTSLGAIVLTTGGAAALAIPQYARLKASLDTLEISGKRAALGVGLASAGIAAAGLIIGYFATQQAEATALTGELKDSLDQASGATTAYTRSLIEKKLAESGAFDAAKNEGISQRELTDAVLAGGDALDKVNAKLSARNNVVDFFNGSGIAASFAEDSIRGLTDGLEDSKHQLDDQAASAEGSTTANDAAAESYKNAADEAAQLQSNLQQLIDTINEANGVGQDAVTTNDSYRTALDGAKKSVAEFAAAHGVSAKNVDESTTAGAKNAAMFADLAKKSQDAAQAQFDLDNNVDAYQSRLQSGRAALVQQITDLTGSKDAAEALADKIYAIPTAAEFTVIAHTSEAERRLAALRASLALFKSSGYGINVSGYVGSVDRQTPSKPSGTSGKNGAALWDMAEQMTLGAPTTYAPAAAQQSVASTVNDNRQWVFPNYLGGDRNRAAHELKQLLSDGEQNGYAR